MREQQSDSQIMLKTFHRITSWLKEEVYRRHPSGSPYTGVAREHIADRHPLTGIRRAVRDAGLVVEQQFEGMRLVEGRLTLIEEQLNRAWRERDQLVREY